MVDLYNMTGFYDEDALISSIEYSHLNMTDTHIKKAQKARNFVTDFVSNSLWMGRHRHGDMFSSGSESNEVALLIAKKSHSNPLIIGTSLTHSSIQYSCEKLDLEYLQIPVRNETYDVSADELGYCIKKAGNRPVLVCLTMGTTLLGSVADFELNGGFEEILGKNVTLHIDAAYGGPILSLLKEYAYLEKYMNLASTVTVDVHKIIGPIGCSVLLANQVIADYFRPKDVYFDSYLTYFGTSRSAFAAEVARKIITKQGVSGLHSMANNCVYLARKTRQSLSECGAEIFSGCDTGIVTIKLDSEAAAHRAKLLLRKKGFAISVAKIRLKGGNFEHGIRLAVTPKKLMTEALLSDFVSVYKNL